jgi:hypothetical protein
MIIAPGPVSPWALLQLAFPAPPAVGHSAVAAE